jgi:hypothetical protein
MAHHQVHCQDCQKELGEEFRWVHLWLDCLKPAMGHGHRKMRHNRETVEKLRELFGDRVARAAEIHIERDYICRHIPTYEESVTKWWLYGW